MSEQPEFVVSKVPLDSPENYFETVLDPDEAIEYATQLLNDAARAKRMRETNAWLKQKRNSIEPSPVFASLYGRDERS